MGGKLEGLYYAFGETDVFVIVDLPHNASAAVALTLGASGAAAIKTTVLMTPSESVIASRGRIAAKQSQP